MKRYYRFLCHFIVTRRKGDNNIITLKILDKKKKSRKNNQRYGFDGLRI